MHPLIRERWSEVEGWLDRLFELDADAQQDWLAQHCADAELRAAIAEVLTADTTDSSALDRAQDHLAGAGALEGRRFGAYRLIRLLGEGGSASVFLAERDTGQFRQQVALKLMRHGLYHAEQRQRFARERQILAQLEHPHIARLIDGGMTDEGVPYIVMEFVDGTPVTEYCDGANLPLRARLQLFLAACQAVQYAHQHLIVHRDLKPSNILVDREGRLKLLDFGIAKLLAGDDTERTATDVRHLTPTYAAPEQFSGAAVTTATDVYALGVLLYELLAGSRPARADRAEAEAPSLAVQRADDDPGPARACSRSQLRAALRGDLDTLVLHALAADPQRRYAGAGALAEEVGRWLDGRPLTVRRDSLVYRMRKFAQRNRVAVAAAAAISVTLAVASVVSLRQAAVARSEAQRAEQQARIATDESARANAVIGFMQGLFDSAAPGVSTTENVDELLARGRERVEGDFAQDAGLRAQVLGLIGDLTRRRGRADDARAPLEQAATLAQQQFGATDARSMHAEALLAQQAYDTGRFAQGAARLQHALDEFTKGGSVESEASVQALTRLGLLYQRAGDNDKALAHAQQALAQAQRVLAPDDPLFAEVQSNLGDVLMESARYAEAVPLLQAVLTRRQHQFGAQHAEVAHALAGVASAKYKLGDYPEAVRLLRETVSIDAKAYTRPHHRAASHLNNLGVYLVATGDLDGGVAAIRQSIAIDRQLYPNGHPETADALFNVAMVRLRQGDYAEAEPAAREAIAEQVRLRGADYPDNGYDKNSLARILICRGKFDEAQRLLDEALADAKKTHGEKHIYVGSALLGQAVLAQRRNEPAQAVARARESLALYEALLPPNHGRVSTARLVLGENLFVLGHTDEAHAVFSTALAQVRSANQPAPVLLAHAWADVARSEVALHHAEAAQEARQQAHAALAQMQPGRNAEREEVLALLR